MDEKTKLNLICLLGLDYRQGAIDCRKTLTGDYLIVSVKTRGGLNGIHADGIGKYEVSANKKAIRARWNRFTETEKRRIRMLATKKGIALDREFGLKL